jgi:hypothetical protein
MAVSKWMLRRLERDAKKYQQVYMQTAHGSLDLYYYFILWQICERRCHCDKNLISTRSVLVNPCPGYDKYSANVIWSISCIL